MAENKKAIDVSLLSYFRRKMINDDIPTKVSELENDKGYLTNNDLGDYAKKSDIHVTVNNNVITFNNGLTIVCNPDTGEVNFTYNP